MKPPRIAAGVAAAIVFLAVLVSAAVVVGLGVLGWWQGSGPG